MAPLSPLLPELVASAGAAGVPFNGEAEALSASVGTGIFYTSYKMITVRLMLGAVRGINTVVPKTAKEELVCCKVILKMKYFYGVSAGN